MSVEPGDQDAARIDAEAGQWFVELQAESVAPELRGRFEQWLAADPRHAAAFEELKSCWADLGSMTHWAATEPVPEPVAEPALQPFESAQAVDAAASLERSRRAGGVLAWLGLGGSGPAPRAGRFGFPYAVPALAVAVLAVMLVLRWSRDEIQVAQSFATGIAEVRTIGLADGSTVTLGGRSAVEVHFTDRERRVVLRSGEAFFDVRKDASRPFLVSAAGTVTRAIGTQFDVLRSASQQVRVAVLEGLVEVSAASAPATSTDVRRRVAAGQQVASTQSGRLGEVRPSTGFGATWRTGRLVYEDASLEDVIADLGRYYDGRIELADPSLEQLRVSASFEAGDIDAMIDTLVLGFPLEAERVAPRHIVLRPGSSEP